MPGHEQLGGELETYDEQGKDEGSLPREILQGRQWPRKEDDGDNRQSEERPHDAVDATV